MASQNPVLGVQLACDAPVVSQRVKSGGCGPFDRLGVRTVPSHRFGKIVIPVVNIHCKVHSPKNAAQERMKADVRAAANPRREGPRSLAAAFIRAKSGLSGTLVGAAFATP